MCGTVIRTGTVRARFLCAIRHYIVHVFWLQIKMLEWKKTYECTNMKCHFQFQVIADVERDNIIEMPV